MALISEHSEVNKMPTENSLPFELGSSYATIYTPGVRPALELKENIAVVLNVSRLVDPSQNGGFTLAAGHVLRKANEPEIEAIKEVFKDYGPDPSWVAWECAKLPKGKYKQLPEDQWRYFVITFAGSNATMVEIERTLSIALVDVKIAFTLLTRPFPKRPSYHPTIIFEPGRLFYFLQGVRHGSIPFVDITTSDVQSIRILHEQLQLSEHSVVNIKRLIQQILDLEALPPESPLRFLGYFAILESMLTHQPKKTDTIDSITRQIMKKVALLDNRWKPRIDYGSFQGAKPDTIWSNMYAYRSSLAHGGEPNFESDLQLLGDHTRASNLLKHTVKAVLRQALIEPQLIVDIRNC
jgi:hypothetical protein